MGSVALRPMNGNFHDPEIIPGVGLVEHGASHQPNNLVLGGSGGGIHPHQRAWPAVSNHVEEDIRDLSQKTQQP